jgi:hypothetical protein
MGDAAIFNGTLLTIPFATGSLQKTITDQYRQLLDSHDSEEILVLTGSPTSMTTVRELLDDEVPGAAVPRVTSPVVQATDVVNKTDERTILSDALRLELVHRFLEEYEWETDYLRRAANQPSFPKDIAQLMETHTWQQTTFDTTPELVEVAAAVDAFQEWLAEHNHMERGQIIAEALPVLEETARRDEVVDATAVLVVEFEEFFPLDRRYLSTLADGLDLICIAETDASVRRTGMETGAVTDRVSFTTERHLDGETPSTRPAATAAYLARGDVPDDPKTGRVDILAAETADEQLDAVADEIERLRDRDDWTYEDIAVACPQSGSAVTDTIRTLERSGIPTESTSVVGFGDDPAVRELLRVVRYLAPEPTDRPAADVEDPITDESMLEAIAAMDGLADPLRRWATESGLKTRIAEETHPLDARSQFGNVRRVFRMASFVEDTPFMEASWSSFAELLERAHEYAPQYNQTSATERDGGIRVDHPQALKNGRFRAVFVLNIVDEEYPGEPWLTRLFPRERVANMPDYPGVTTIDEAAVDATFTTDSTESSRPFRQYYAEHSRRRLAVGSAAASERLYCCLYEYEDTALQERAQPSRFLTKAYERLSWLSEAGDHEIRSEQAAEEFLLSRIDRALADVRRTHSQDVTVSLDEFEDDLVEIQALLDASDERGEDLRDALRARVDFADGGVARE